MAGRPFSFVHSVLHTREMRGGTLPQGIDDRAVARCTTSVAAKLVANQEAGILMRIIISERVIAWRKLSKVSKNGDVA